MEVAMEICHEEGDSQRVREELSRRLVERVVHEVVVAETLLAIQEAYRYMYIVFHTYYAKSYNNREGQCPTHYTTVYITILQS